MTESKRKNWIKNSVGLLLAPALAFALLRWFEFRTVYQPSSQLKATGEELGFARDEVWLRAADGVRLHAWYFPETNAPKSRVFLVCHGNGGNISHRLELYDVLRRAGAGVLAFDYRGYGRSEGRPSERGTYLDAEAAYEWLVVQGYSPGEIIAFGESLGGGVVSELSLRHELGAIVLMSTYTSAEDMGAELFPWLPVRTIGKIKYRTRERLPRIRVPVLVMHSDDDTIIPAHHGRRNFATANPPKLFQILQGDHNETFLVDRSSVVEGIQRFLAMLDEE